jgi:hypothetical protein
MQLYRHVHNSFGNLNPIFVTGVGNGNDICCNNCNRQLYQVHCSVILYYGTGGYLCMFALLNCCFDCVGQACQTEGPPRAAWVTFGNMADIYAIVRVVPHTCQHLQNALFAYYCLLVANEGNYMRRLFLKKNFESLSIGVRIAMIRCVFYLSRTYE